MTRRLVLQGLGTHVALDLCDPDPGFEDAAVWQQLQHVWARCLADTDTDVAGTVRVRLGDRLESQVTVERDPERLMVATTQAVTHAFINARVGEMLLLHAGAVCHPETGRALVYVAPGGTGKSTLTRLLGRRYAYLTDETVAITADGVILPYPKPLSMRRDGLPKDELSPDDLGLLRPTATPRVAKIVLLRRDDALAEPRIERLDLLDAVAGIVPESSSLSRLDRGLHVVAGHLDASGGGECWTYNEADQLVDRVAEVIG